MPDGYDTFVAAGTPAGFPTKAEIATLLETIRALRLVVIGYSDSAKKHQAAETDAEIANQMVETIQAIGGSSYQLDKAIGVLEKVYGSVKGYPDTLTRMVDIVTDIRARP